MQATDVVLAIVAENDEPLLGRTYLQKMAYFVADALGADLEFGPHYYGPYSRIVSAACATLVGRGIVDESVSTFASGQSSPFEGRKYAYDLSNQEPAYLETVRKEEPELFEKTRQVVSAIGETHVDVQQLSCAAKVHYVLRASDGPMTPERIREQCTRLSWDLKDRDIAAAVAVLEKLGLAQRAA